MTLYPLDYLRNPTTVPLPVGGTPAGGAIATAAYESSRNLLRQNPAPFVARTRPVAGGLRSNAIPLALELWQLWANENLWAPITFTPPTMNPAATYRLSGRVIWRSAIGSLDVQPFGEPPEEIFTSGQLEGGSIEVVSGSGPTQQRSLAVRSRSQFGVLQTIFLVSSRSAEFWTSVALLNLNVELLAVPQPVPLVFPPTFPLQTPQTAPLPVRVPLVIPLAPIPGLVPVPTEVPGYLPEPFNLPNRPIPFIPDPPPEEEEDPPVLPPITITPDGIEVGTPGGPIVLTPGGGTITTTTPSPQEQREARRRGPDPCIDIDIEPPSPDCCDCEEIREIVIEELDNKFPPSRPNNLKQQTYSAANSRNIPLPRFCESVQLLVVDAPANRKTQSGGNAGLNVYYNGWYAFGINGSGGERLPVHYDSQVMFPPAGSDSFSYTLYDGTMATVLIVYREEV